VQFERRCIRGSTLSKNSSVELFFGIYHWHCRY
jgi:hypothetical protein